MAQGRATAAGAFAAPVDSMVELASSAC